MFTDDVLDSILQDVVIRSDEDRLNEVPKAKLTYLRRSWLKNFNNWSSSKV